VGLEKLPVSRVVGRIRGGEYVTRVTERDDVERDRAPIAVALNETDEVGREVVRTAHALTDERGI